MTWYVTRGGANPQHSARIGVISTAAGSWSVSLAGQTKTVSIVDASSEQGVGFVDFYGLPVGEHTATVSDGIRSETCRVVITSGPHISLVGSCFSTYSWWDEAAGAMEIEQATQVLAIGDAPYVDNLRQVTLASPATNAQREIVIRQENRKFKTHASRRRLLSDSAVYQIISDHDATPGNDAPGRDDIGAFPGEDACNWWYYNGGYAKIITATGAAGEAEWRDLLDRGFAAFDLYNPLYDNPDAGAVYPSGTIPSATPYTRWTVGRVEYFQIEQTRYADYMTAVSTVTDRSLLGALQLEWFLHRLAASTADFRVVLSPQQMLKPDAITTGGRNDYGRKCFLDERDTIFAAMAAKPGTVVFAGDVHTPSVLRYASGGAELWQITPCPTGTDGVVLEAETSADTEVRWRERHQVGSSVPRRYYGVISDTGDGPLELTIKSHTGGVCWRGQLSRDSNAISYGQAGAVG